MKKTVFCAVILLFLTSSCELFRDDRPAPAAPPCELQHVAQKHFMSLPEAVQMLVTSLTMKLIMDGIILEYEIDPASLHGKETNAVMSEILRTGYARRGKTYIVSSKGGKQTWSFSVRKKSDNRIYFERTIPLR